MCMCDGVKEEQSINCVPLRVVDKISSGVLKCIYYLRAALAQHKCVCVVVGFSRDINESLAYLLIPCI